MDRSKNHALDFFIKHTNYSPNQVSRIEPIHNGFTNLSYLIETSDQQKYQVRFALNNELVNRVNEYQVITLLKNDLFIYFDQATGDCIKKWIVGHEVDYFDQTRLENLAKGIKKIHQVPLGNCSILPIDYYKGIENAKLATRHKRLYLSLINKYRDLPKHLTHSDLNAHNILVDEYNQIHLIDFEWSRINNAYFDLANMARESLSLEQAYYLVDCYGGLDLKIFNEFLIISCLFALIWTYNMQQTDKIIAYRKDVEKRLAYYLESFVVNL